MTKEADPNLRYAGTALPDYLMTTVEDVTICPACHTVFEGPPIECCPAQSYFMLASRIVKIMDSATEKPTEALDALFRLAEECRDIVRRKGAKP